jgi:hypothetical protein
LHVNNGAVQRASHAFTQAQLDNGMGGARLAGEDPVGGAAVGRAHYVRAEPVRPAQVPDAAPAPVFDQSVKFSLPELGWRRELGMLSVIVLIWEALARSGLARPSPRASLRAGAS